MNERRMFPQAPYDSGGGWKKAPPDFPLPKRKEMVVGWCGEGIDVNELVVRLGTVGKLEMRQQVQAQIQRDLNKNGPLIMQIKAEDVMIAKGQKDALLPKIAEVWFLEGADPNGGVVTKGPKWYGEDVMVCRASVLDDVCRRVDAGVGFVVEDPKTKEKRLSFLGVDITVDNQGFETKARKNLMETLEFGTSSMYWYDADHEPGEAYTRPEEGIIPIVNTALYVNDELLKLFMDAETKPDQAADLMRRFKPVLIRQQQLQLEILAISLLRDADLINIQRGQVVPKTLTTRGKLIEALYNPVPMAPPQSEALLIIRTGLEKLWALEKSMGGHAIVKNVPDLRRLMPSSLADQDTLPVEVPATGIK